MSPREDIGLDPTARRETVRGRFEAHFGRTPRLWVRAPGRVDLMGSHTDYNQGYVLTLPIDRETWIAASPRDDDEIHVYSLNLDEHAAFPAVPTDGARVDGWSRYIQGVAVALAEAGHIITGFNGVVHGTVPLSSGLSSSASLEAAAATLFELLGGYRIDAVEKAKLAQRAENRWVGVNCGILDQYTCILGEKSKALVLDCRSLTHVYADFPADLRVVICNTCAPRKLTGSEYGDRRAQCEEGAAHFAGRYPGVSSLRDVSIEQFERHEAELSPTVARRSRFIIEENARVIALADAFQANDRAAIAALTAASFAGARDLFEISVPEMQAMYDAMHAAPGCVGCRQAGAGFGGCMVAIVVVDQVEDFCHFTAGAYEQTAGRTPEIYAIRTAAGAGALDAI